MHSIRRRNWILKRIVLGFAVAALVAPAAAQARVDEGGAGQPNSIAEVSKGSDFIPGHTDFPGAAYPTVNAGDYGMPRAMPSDYAIQRGDLIEVVRAQPRNEVRAGDRIELVRLHPRTVSTPQVVSSPGFDWGDAGIGAGLALGLALLGGAAIRATRHLGQPQTA
jgi:hypothetical protein